MFGKISFLLKGDPCAPVCRDVQCSLLCWGEGEGRKLRIGFKVLLF